MDKKKKQKKRNPTATGERRVIINERPLTLRIDDTPENVARALLGLPLERTEPLSKEEKKNG